MGEIYEVIALGLNLRDQPGVQGAVIAVLDQGASVEKIGEADARWWKVRVSLSRNIIEEGFVAAAHLRAVEIATGFRIPFFRDLRASFDRIAKFVGANAERLGAYSMFTPENLPKLNRILAEYGINRNAKRFTHFLAQIAHESASFSRLEENLNYSGEALWKKFRKYFRDEAEARSFHRQPERIANRIYASRIGNGDEASGDGWRYRGRGFIQLTGRGNYREVGKAIGVDLEGDPDILVRDLPTALRASCAFWDINNINAIADRDDLRAVTRAVNGGDHGLADRERHLARARRIWA